MLSYGVIKPQLIHALDQFSVASNISDTLPSPVPQLFHHHLSMCHGKVIATSAM